MRAGNVPIAAGTLADFIREDLSKKYPALVAESAVTLVQVY